MNVAILLILMAMSACEQRAPMTQAPPAPAVSAHKAPIAVKKSEREHNQDAVAVWVDGEPIHERIVDQKLARIEAYRVQQNRPLSESERELRRLQIVDALIDDKLIREHAKKNAVNVTARRITDEIARRATTIFGSAENLERHLRFRGITRDDYLEEVRRELLIQALVESAPVSNEERVARFEEMYKTPAQAPGARISVVNIQGTSDVSLPASFSDLKRLAAPKMSRHELGWLTTHDDPTLPSELFDPTGPKSSKVIRGETTSIYWVHKRKPLVDSTFESKIEMIDDAIARDKHQVAARELFNTLREHATIRKPSSSKSD